MKVISILKWLSIGIMAIGYSANAQLQSGRDSGSFQLQGTTWTQYEGDVLPSSVGYTVTTSPSGALESDYASVSNSILYVNDLSSTNNTLHYTFPSSMNLSQATGFTWEARLKVDDYQGYAGFPVLEGLCFTVAGYQGFNIGFTTNQISLFQIASGSNPATYYAFNVDMKSDFQTVRVARYEQSGTNYTALYVNGTLLTNGAITGTNSGFSFGDSSSQASAQYEIDYIRIDNTGAYAALIPELDTVTCLTIAFILLLATMTGVELWKRWQEQGSRKKV